MRLGNGSLVVLIVCYALTSRWLYIQENPVRAGLVKDWKDWPYRFEFNEQTEL
jgi:hypothetical protein